MTIMVRNDSHNIEVVYENAEIVKGCGMFQISMENNRTATFHNVDPEDGTEWDCFILKH